MYIYHYTHEPKQVKLPMGFGFVQYKTSAEAEEAKKHMDGGQIDGQNVQVWFSYIKYLWIVRLNYIKLSTCFG